MKEAGMNAIRRIINAKEDRNMDNSEDDGNEQSCEYCIVFSDIQHALKKVQPSA